MLISVSAAHVARHSLCLAWLLSGATHAFRGAGTFYCTSQHTTEIFSADNIAGPWTKLADINVTVGGETVGYSKMLPNVEE